MSNTAKKLGGKVAIITGSSSGLGAATAVLFSKLGANVVLTGRDETKLHKVAEECQGEPEAKQPLIHVGDVTKEADSNALLQKTLEKHGKLDVLVNNAGVQELGSLQEMTMEQFDRVFNINVRSVVYLTKICQPHLVASKGCIVNVSSISGIRAFPGLMTYCMSKCVIDQFTKCLALELAPKQVRVNCINPGVIAATDLFKTGSGMDEEKYQKFLERCATTHPLGRAGCPNEVAQTIAFLASDDASFITGAQVPIDGGRQAACPR